MDAHPLEALADDPPRRARFDIAPPPEVDLPHVAGLLAGAAEVDITPPPGLPKAGHSANARTGVGFRTRLRAHVLHLRAGRSSVALVQCDLLAGSAVVQQLVARAVADTDVRLPGLFVGATHTHAGPGLYHGTQAMNRFSANRPGFDPAWTSWLADRIAGAVHEAVATRRPAVLATGATDVWGLTRNRSIESWLRNESVTDRSPTPQRIYEAVNPRLHLVRVDAAAADGGFAPLASAVVFSIHGTGISHHDDAYNADVWAYLKGELRTHTGAVVGAMEGTHGDVAPNVRPGLLVYPEAERVGREIGRAAAGLWDSLESALTSEVDLSCGLREIDLRTVPELPAPAFGAATISGARENETPVIHRIPPFAPGWGKRGRGPHGAKWITGGRRIHDLVVPPAGMPAIMPVHALRIGRLLILGLPFEITTEAGRRIEAAALPHTSAARIAVSSLANEQFCYLTTPEEYSLQRYEGGNTLFGPRSQPVVARLAADLVRDLERDGHVADHLRLRRFDVAARRYLARPTGTAAEPRRAAAMTYVDHTRTEDGYWQFTWYDAAPGDLAWHKPLARVEIRQPDGSWRLVTDDQGYHLGVLHLGPTGPRADDRHRYAARWYTPYLGPGAIHRVVARGLASDPFA